MHAAGLRKICYYSRPQSRELGGASIMGGTCELWRPLAYSQGRAWLRPVGGLAPL
jgi:hypothetical protein